MTPTNTPLTDAVAKAIGRHLAEYASRRSEGQHGTLADTAFDIGVELEAIRTLETRLHAAEELLRRAEDGLNRWTHGHVEESSKIVCTCCERHNCAEDCECSKLLSDLAAHLASAANPASATTTKETRP
jgi:hypothetical protein